MAIKTFNVDAQTYEEFSKHCRENGISMSRKVENFIKGELERIKFGKIPERVKADASKKEEKDDGEHPLGKYC
jgi:hypothetical protein